jgi:hypothetical protein
MKIVSENLFVRYYSNQEANLTLSTEKIGGGEGDDDNLQGKLILWFKQWHACNYDDDISSE